DSARRALLQVGAGRSGEAETSQRRSFGHECSDLADVAIPRGETALLRIQEGPPWCLSGLELDLLNAAPSRCQAGFARLRSTSSIPSSATRAERRIDVTGACAYPTSDQGAQFAGTQRKTSPATDTRPTAECRWVAAKGWPVAASSCKRPSRTRTVSSGSVSKPLCHPGHSKPGRNTASPPNMRRSLPDSRRTTLCPGVCPPVRETTTPGATSCSFSHGCSRLP